MALHAGGRGDDGVDGSRREAAALSAADHARFAIQGALIFSTNFYLFYLGGQYLASGLLSVVFSLASVFNLLLSAVVFRQRIEPRVAFGAAIGFAGIGLIYWPEIAGTEFDHDALVGLLLCIGGTLFFCSGNMMSTFNQRRGLPVVSTNAWGMAYGALIMTALALVNGRTFQVEWTLPYLGGLVWLAIVSSVIAFASYLTLLGGLARREPAMPRSSSPCSRSPSRPSSKVMCGRLSRWPALSRSSPET